MFSYNIYSFFKNALKTINILIFTIVFCLVSKTACAYKQTILFQLKQNNYLFIKNNNGYFLNENQMIIKMIKKSHFISYGITYKLNTNISESNNGYSRIGQEGWFFINKNYGIFEFGSYSSVLSYISAYHNQYQVQSDASYYISQINIDKTYLPQTIFHSGLWSEQKIFGIERNNTLRFTYITPQNNHSKLAISFIPSSYNKSQIPNNKEPFIGNTQGIRQYEATTAYRHILQFGYQYRKMFTNNLGIKLSITGEYGKPKNKNVRFFQGKNTLCNLSSLTMSNLFSWECAISATYLGFIASGSYGQSSFGFSNKNMNTKNNESYSLELMYHLNRFIISTKHFESNNNILNDLVISNRKIIFNKKSHDQFTAKSSWHKDTIQVSYKLQKGIIPYLEGHIANYKFRDEKQSYNVKGLLLGIYIQI